MSTDRVERRELADLCGDMMFRYHGIITSSGPQWADELTAAGYRKPRTITTAEELDDLPERAVYMDADGEAYRANGGGFDDSSLNSGGLTDPRDVELPATVLWEPLP